MGLFMITGYLGLFPNVLLSRGNASESLQIVDVMARADSLRVILIAVLVFYPIIIGYQTWKYIKFSKKIKLNDE
jgi:cytochrome d ubiquinol oxidase subunit II